MSWADKINEIYLDRSVGDDWDWRPAYRDPAAKEALSSIESTFELVLPEALRSLLEESNGVMNMMSVGGGDWFEENWLIWPIEQILEDNRWLRATYDDREVEQFLFFSWPGVDGIRYGFPVAESGRQDMSIYAWYPDSTPTKFLCAGLESFIRGVIAEGITL